MIKVLVETGRINPETALSEKPLIGLNILDIGCGGDGFLSEVNCCITIRVYASLF